MKPKYYYTYLLVVFGTLSLFFLAIFLVFRTSDSEKRLPPKPILLTQTFNDVEWLSNIGVNELSERIPDSLEKNKFLKQAKKLVNHMALEEAITGRLNTMEIIDLKIAVNELDKTANKLIQYVKKEDVMYLKQYIERIRELNQKVDYLEIMAS